MNATSAELWRQEEVATGIFRLQLRPYGPVRHVEPGRFFMLGIGLGHDPLLRRPLSHLRTVTTDEGILAMEFLYEVRGRGTEILSRLRPPRILSFIGPLGRGWRLDPRPERVILVGGGLGMVPLYAAALALALRRTPAAEFIFGARTGRGLVLAQELRPLVKELTLCTEDGCVGEKGLATESLSRALDRGAGKPAQVLACGPRPMLKEVARLAAERGLPCQVSLEARMACGMGACLTCAVGGVAGHNLRVCKDGPVFAAEEIDWEALDARP